ncbi:MAG: TetR/AcrR family transcriptional regulator [Lachnospiraceae bacterium]|nr:TetR/AcrR family transcriptional regulator [Lachnospiraceae bacterium]
MPKIIPNVREDILTKSALILAKKGYKGFTAREIAKECNIAVGTLYNYFDGTDMIMAELMLNDWNVTMTSVEKEAEKQTDFVNGLLSMCDVVREFVVKYEPIWSQYRNQEKASSYIGKYGSLVREQMSQRVILLIEKTNEERLKPLCAVLVEIMLSCILQDHLTKEHLKLLLQFLV